MIRNPPSIPFKEQRTKECTWLVSYFDRYRETLFRSESYDKLLDLKTILMAAKDRGNKVILAGNGGSASIASHAAVDLTKVANIRSVNFNEANLITCFSNDYGFESWIKRALEEYADPKDVVILISSSGRSANMICAGEHARRHQLPLVTLTGFSENNPLRALGDLNLWVDSRSYNIVENTHQIWLTGVSDLIAGSAETPST